MKVSQFQRRRHVVTASVVLVVLIPILIVGIRSVPKDKHVRSPNVGGALDGTAIDDADNGIPNVVDENGQTGANDNGNFSTDEQVNVDTEEPETDANDNDEESEAAANDNDNEPDADADLNEPEIDVDSNDEEPEIDADGNEQVDEPTNQHDGEQSNNDHDNEPETDTDEPNGTDNSILLQHCQGHCHNDDNCVGELVCHQRNAGETVPGCVVEESAGAFCIREEDLDPRPFIKYTRDRIIGSPHLGMCEGDCDFDDDCAGDLVCFQKGPFKEVPGCRGGQSDTSHTDFCIRPELMPAAATKAAAPVPKNPFAVSSSATYHRKGNLIIPSPRDVEIGDLLVLFLSRTDDVLPVEILSDSLPLSGFVPIASCLKQYNDQPVCAIVQECVDDTAYEADGYRYCRRFRIEYTKSDGTERVKNVDGQDLGTVVFAKYATQADVDRSSYEAELDGSHAAWAAFVALRNAALEPRDFAGTSCDRKDETVFPSTYAEAGDLLLMSMAFDDTAERNQFLPPSGTELEAFEKGSDEAGFVFRETIRTTGETGRKRTGGPGSYACKDVNLSLVFRGK